MVSLGGTITSSTLSESTPTSSSTATTSWPMPTSLLTNGFGGSYYTREFNVPVYNHDSSSLVLNTATWASIDDFAQFTAGIGSVSGVCLGFCLSTLIYVVALTPKTKRGRPFHVLLLLALTAEIMRLLFDLIRISKPGVSPYSAYLTLTIDTGSTYYSTEYIDLSIAKQSSAIFAYIFTVGCLFIQATSLLSNIRLNHSRVYWMIIVVLLAASALALSLRIAFTINSIWMLQRKDTTLPFGVLSQGSLLAYAATFGSWCLVSLVSVVYLILTRIRLTVASDGLYQVALAVLAIISLESFIVPLVLCILSLSQYNTGTRLDDLIIPTVLILLPLGSLFTNIHTMDIQQGKRPERKPKDDSSGLSTRQLIDSSNSTTVVVNPNDVPDIPDAYQEVYKMKSFDQKKDNTFQDLIDRELQQIDSMETSRHSNASQELAVGYAADGDVLQQRARRVMRNLAARSTTPSSFQANVV